MLMFELLVNFFVVGRIEDISLVHAGKATICLTTS